MTKKVYLIISIVFVALIIAAGIIFSLSYNQYAVKVNGERISVHDFKVYLKMIKTEIESQAKAQDGKTSTEDIWKVKIEGTDPEVFARDKALDEIIRLTVINQQAAKMNIRLTEEEEILVKERMKMEQVQNGLKEYEIQGKDLEEIVRKSIVSSKLSNSITKDISVSNEELDKFIANYRDISKAYNVRHILLVTKDQNNNEYPADKQKQILDKANDILKKVKAGEDFSKLAKQYSEDPRSKEQGGFYEFFMGEFVKEFEETTKKLNPGEISGLVKTEYGYHIIKLESIAKPTAEKLESVRLQYKDTLLRIKRDEVFNSNVEKWLKEAKIEKNNELINSIKINEI